MNLKRFILGLITCLCLMQGTGAIAVDNKPDDADALTGLNEGKVVWDITVSKPSKLLFLLKVIETTYDDLVRQGVEPDMIFTFHGRVVRLISSNPVTLSLEEEQAHEELRLLIQKLSKLPGVKMESCSVAARFLGIDNATIMDEIKPVGNTYVSLIGYQKKGYALIPIY